MVTVPLTSRGRRGGDGPEFRLVVSVGGQGRAVGEDSSLGLVLRDRHAPFPAPGGDLMSSVALWSVTELCVGLLCALLCAHITFHNKTALNERVNESYHSAKEGLTPQELPAEVGSIRGSGETSAVLSFLHQLFFQCPPQTGLGSTFAVLAWPEMWRSPRCRDPAQGQAHRHPTPWQALQWFPIVLPHRSPGHPMPPGLCLGPESGSPASGTNAQLPTSRQFSPRRASRCLEGLRQTWPRLFLWASASESIE